jgi:hypothetical protein
MNKMSAFPRNRFAALDEIQHVLGFRRCELLSFLEALSKAEDAFLRYDFGDLAITFTINEGLLDRLTAVDASLIPVEDHNKAFIRVALELQKENVCTSVVYRYTLDELKLLGKTQQSTIASFGEC